MRLWAKETDQRKGTIAARNCAHVLVFRAELSWFLPLAVPCKQPGPVLSNDNLRKVESFAVPYLPLA